MKDLSDAENYLDMMRSRIAALKNEAEAGRV
jgi:hypothetical protein